MAMTPESLFLLDDFKKETGGGLLDRAADAAVSDVHPFGDFLPVFVDGERLFDVGGFGLYSQLSAQFQISIQLGYSQSPNSTNKL